MPTIDEILPLPSKDPPLRVKTEHGGGGGGAAKKRYRPKSTFDLLQGGGGEVATEQGVSGHPIPSTVLPRISQMAVMQVVELRKQRTRTFTTRTMEMGTRKEKDK